MSRVERSAHAAPKRLLGKLWIVIARPDRFHAALLAAQSLREYFRGGCHLLRENSVWWERAAWQPYAARFDSVRAFKRVETCRGIVDIPRLYRETAARQRGMANLEIDSEQDVLLVLGGVLAIANAAVSAYPRVFKILAVGKNVYQDLTRPIDRARFRFTTSGWFQNRLVDPAAGLNRTVHLKPRINPGGDGVRIGRMEKEPAEIYDAVVISSNTASAPPFSSQIIAARQPTISQLRNLPRTDSTDEERRVIFFGTPFLLIHNLEPAVYIEHANRCLDFLRRHFPPPCRLIYRPHPAETAEASKLKLVGFTVEDDREAAELYFLQHFESIAAVFSVSSTVSRIALDNGLNAYALWRCFPFSPTAAEFFQRVMGDVPPDFDIRDLSHPPAPFAHELAQRAVGIAFTDALREAVSRRLRVVAEPPI